MAEIARLDEAEAFVAPDGSLVRELAGPGDCAAIPPGTPHKLWNTSADAPLVLLCCSAPAYSDEDTFITEPSEPSA